jgi:hypothetical protein
VDKDSPDQSRTFRLLKNLATLKLKYCVSSPETERCFDQIAEDLDWLIRLTETGYDNPAKKREPVKEIHKGIQFINDVFWGPNKK